MATYFIAGGNRGIGLAIVKELLKNPENNVIATVRDKTKNNLLSLKTEKLFIVEVDFSDSFENIKSAVDTIESKFPNGVDGVIYNAGIALRYDADEIHLEDLEKTYEVNVFGAARTFNAIKPYLFKKDNGVKKTFLFISSSAGIRDRSPYLLHVYGSSKAAVLYLATSLASKAKLSSDKLYHDSFIASICPGLVVTDMTASLPEEVLKSGNTPETSAAGIVDILLNPKPEYEGAFVSYNGDIL